MASNVIRATADQRSNHSSSSASRSSGSSLSSLKSSQSSKSSNVIPSVIPTSASRVNYNNYSTADLINNFWDESKVAKDEARDYNKSLSDYSYAINASNARGLNEKSDYNWDKLLNYNYSNWLSAMQYDREMSNTAIQRQVEDMKKAGINPVLASRYGGANYNGGSNYAMAGSLPMYQFAQYGVNYDNNNYYGALLSLLASLTGSEITERGQNLSATMSGLTNLNNLVSSAIRILPFILKFVH